MGEEEERMVRGRKERRERIREKIKEEKREKGKKEKGEGVEGHFRDSTKTEEGGCKMPGGGNRKRPGGWLGFALGFALLGFWA